ncbi:hypothetical protein INR49_005483 [Caranx melampygus]|nr:hypothetical protein INR49_005483 [Caranx melampygus]
MFVPEICSFHQRRANTRPLLTSDPSCVCLCSPGDDLMRCVDLYNQTQSKWFEEMVTTSMELEKLEVERIEWIQQHLRQYTTLRHETDMFNQSMVEPVDQLLQNVDPAKDRELWVKENKTGEYYNTEPQNTFNNTDPGTVACSDNRESAHPLSDWNDRRKGRKVAFI